MGTFFIVTAGLGVVAWALVDIWRRSDEPAPFRWGWSVLALGGQFSLPGWRLGEGWYAAVPFGALAYLILARSGPLRRRNRDSHEGEQSDAEVQPGGR